MEKRGKFFAKSTYLHMFIQDLQVSGAALNAFCIQKAGCWIELRHDDHGYLKPADRSGTGVVNSPPMI